MANDLLQSSQNKETTAPGYYTDYLSNLASKGQQAASQAQFAGAQPLQTEAFNKVAANFGTGQSGIQSGQNLVGQAAGQNVTGASAPYLQAGTSASPLCAAKPLICQAANLNLGCVASQYMSPYIQSAVQNMSDVAHRNIRNNLSPAATAAAVGSGQFGSQRGAQVLGQVQAQAEQCLNSQISQLLNTGYGQSLQAAQAKQGALGNLANTTSSAQNAQNQANLTAAQTASQAASNQGQLLNQAGQNMGQLAQTGAGMNLACINALSTLGGQQQTIEQNKQNFPLTNLSSLAGLLQGYQMPMGTKTTLCMSPLSGLAAIGSGAMGMVTPGTNGTTPLENIKTQWGKLFPSCTPTTMPDGRVIDKNPAAGGPITYPPEANTPIEGTPVQEPDPCCICLVLNARGGLISSKARGYTGCASTASRGGLPSRKG
jgi:hypothetical protein